MIILQLNIDCLRDVLLFIEEQPFNCSCTVEKIHDELNNYSNDEIEYTCLKLSEANLLNVISISMSASVSERISKVQDLTYFGHELLNNLRSKSVFDKAKNIISEKIGSASIEIISKVASKIICCILGI